jgi:hypothetical protein
MVGIAKLFSDPGFSGHDLQITQDVPNLTHVKMGALHDWNDEARSIDVVAGTWEFWEHVDYKGLHVTVAGPKRGNCLELGIPERWVSSVRKVSD